MRVLVTGGAGYIGSHVVRALQRADHVPAIFDDLSTGHRVLAERTGADLVVGRVDDPGDLDRAFETHRPEAVVHVAGKALVGESVRDPGPYFRVNAVGGLALLEAMRRHAVSRIVFSSTCAVYGVTRAEPIDEQCPREPVTPYGASKLAFEQMLAAYARAYGFRALALRYFNVAGAAPAGDLGEMHHPETHLVPNLLRAAAGEHAFCIYGANYVTRDGTAERDYLHVEDLARAHVLALNRLDILDPLSFGGAVNLGTGRGTTVREMVTAVEDALGIELDVSVKPRRPGDPPSLVANPALAGRALGFKAQHDVASMIQSAQRFWLAERGRPESPLRRRGLPTSASGRNGRPLRFGEAVVAAGYSDFATVERALALQRERDGIGESHKLLGLILLEMGELSSQQLIELLRRMNHPSEAAAGAAQA